MRHGELAGVQAAGDMTLTFLAIIVGSRACEVVTEELRNAVQKTLSLF